MFETLLKDDLIPTVSGSEQRFSRMASDRAASESPEKRNRKWKATKILNAPS